MSPQKPDLEFSLTKCQLELSYHENSQNFLNFLVFGGTHRNAVYDTKKVWLVFSGKTTAARNVVTPFAASQTFFDVVTRAQRRSTEETIRKLRFWP